MYCSIYVENYIKNGQIVPVEITIELLRAAMVKSGKQDFLIDGFPRNRGVWMVCRPWLSCT